MQVYDYNSSLHKFKDLHDETGGMLKQFMFQYYDCFCGESGYRIISTTTRHRNAFNIVQCNKCGTLRINPYMSDASIDAYYRDVYGAIKRANNPAEQNYRLKAPQSAEMLRQLAPFITKQSKILDYGSGAGGRMDALHKAGYDVSVFDADARYMEYAVSRGMKGFSKDSKYDVIVLCHVLEHINDPVSFLKYLGGFLAQGGLIYLQVPMLENNKTLLGDFQLAHKFYFTGESLRYIASMIGYKTIADHRNTIIITAGVAEKKPDLARAKSISDREILRGRIKDRMMKVKVGVRRCLGKKQVSRHNHQRKIHAAV